jgi:hypothetical protein
MARKRKDNKKWKSRPSRRKSHRKKNINQKPSKIHKNNSRLSNPNKPSRQKRKKRPYTTENMNDVLTFESACNEELLDGRLIHNFLTERYDK